VAAETEQDAIAAPRLVSPTTGAFQFRNRGDESVAGRLAGKVAIVTGAASVGPGVGNGKATSILFAREGAKVLLVNRSEAHAKELEAEIQNEGGVCSVFAADVCEPDHVQAMIDAAITRYGRLDILHNNVGAGGPGTVATVSEQVWDNAINVNLKGTMWCCRYAIPHLLASGGGSIINVATVAAVLGVRRGTSGFAAYSAAKAGVIGLTRAIAADYAAQGIRANSLVVGMVNTPLLAKFGEQARERRRLAVPLMTEGTGWDVGWAAVYLASDESRWVTGAAIPIDGGQLSITDFPL
jgi:NAD(P)-dependent dehydrogenase (short-subunit alcohol dehydrogenase family)